MSGPDITPAEIRHMMVVVYFLGLLTAVLIVLVGRILANWRADRRRAEQFRIHRRTPFGI